MMNEEIKRNVWQISAGPSSRSYVGVFLKYGVGLVGPGDAGKWRPERDDEEFEGGFVRRFASEVEIGDVFLLRSSISKIAAIGLVASDYQYLNQFDDVNGWDLQHTRRVRWCKLPDEYDFRKAIFGANPPRVSRLRNEEIIKYAKRFLNSAPNHWQTAPLPELPIEEPILEEIPSYLKGIIAEIHDLAPLFWEWQKKTGDQPAEDEIISHFVVPFLRSLGWPPEKIAIKWRHIDVAVFDTLPRIPENCRFLIEAKRLGKGVEGALAQARDYLRQIGVLRDIIVTDGIRYRMYSCQNEFFPVAYANLTWLKRPATELFSRMKRP